MVAIIILNWNNAADTIQCILSLQRLRNNNFSVVVVDNCSTDDSFSQISNFLQNIESTHIRLVQSKKNGGYAYGNNFGIKIALESEAVKYIWLLNNDTEVLPESLNALLDYATQSSKDIGILGSTLLYHHDKETIQGIGGKHNKWLGTTSHVLGMRNYSPELCSKNRSTPIDYVIGASMFVNRNMIERVGLMNEAFFLYFEEIDWCTRARKSGFSVNYVPESIIYHKEGGTTKRNILSKNSIRNKTIDFYTLRSPLIYARHHTQKLYYIVRANYLVRSFRRFIQGDSSGALLALNFFWHGENFKLPS